MVPVGGLTPVAPAFGTTLMFVVPGVVVSCLVDEATVDASLLGA